MGELKAMRQIGPASLDILSILLGKGWLTLGEIADWRGCTAKSAGSALRTIRGHGLTEMRTSVPLGAKRGRTPGGHRITQKGRRVLRREVKDRGREPGVPMPKRGKKARNGWRRG